MNSFQEFYEDKKAEAEFQAILLEYMPFMPFPASAGTAPAEGAKGVYDGTKEVLGILSDPAGFVWEKIKEFTGTVLEGIAVTASIFMGARILGKAINFIIRKNKEQLEQFNDEVDFERKYEKEIRLAEIAEKGDSLKKSEVIRLKKRLTQYLAEKYTSKEPSWWLDLLDKTGSFLDTKTGGGLAVLAFILI